jgi:hypothetical protein
LIERNIKDQTSDAKYQARHQDSMPILNDLKAWLEKTTVK